MPLDEDLAAWLRLSLTPGLGGEGLRRLLAAFGEPRLVLAASRAVLARHVPEAVAAAIKEDVSARSAAAVGDWLDDPSNRVITLADAHYPQQLLQIADPPPLIYVKGDPGLLS
ncbi:MAG: DNA-protecting protein DprA, partial [Betaproteobacteria bacterium]|nr:DNA-protecting protein DprA [Betaproteobacteria bacterium]